MSSGEYIVKRILSAIPLIIIVSMLSFGIIRLNIQIHSINISLFILLLLSVIVFYFLSRIKGWFLMGIISLISLVAFSWYLASFALLPLPVFFNFILISLLCLIYWLQSYTSKSKTLPQIVTLIALLVVSANISSYFPLSTEIKPIILKSGDPLADLRFNPAISRETLIAEEKRLGLDQPTHIQYLLWLKGVFRGNLGITQQNQLVAKVIQRPVFNTLLLSLTTLFCTWFIAIPLGIWAALKRNKFIDRFFAFLTSCGMSTPSFVLAVLGLLFALKTQVFPIGGLTSINFYEMNGVQKIADILKHLILPTMVLTIIAIAGLQRQMRANLLDVLRMEYIKTAIAKGLPAHKVIYKHALRNAINPLITIFGFEFASLLSGAALTETVLSYPGLGALTLEAARKLDVNLTMTTLMIGAIMLITGNLLADLMLKFADPRIKLAEQ